MSFAELNFKNAAGSNVGFGFYGAWLVVTILNVLTVIALGGAALLTWRWFG